MFLAGFAHRFDVVERWWASADTQRAAGSTLVVVFLVTLAGTEAARMGWVPAALARVWPRSHFAAVGIAFGLLLAFEVAGLIFALAKSVADSVGKQFELLSLILMRESFLEFTQHSDPLVWSSIEPLVPGVLAEMIGALVVFALLVPYHRVQRHRAITSGVREQEAFIAAKKVVAAGLLVAFIALGVQSVLSGAPGGVRSFFSRFYTVLVLSDVLIVLLSLRYTTEFRVVFRNAGFTAATAMARLALSAPPYKNALLATIAMAFALAASAAYNWWTDAEARTASA